MIRIGFPASGLIIAINIDDSTNVSVSSGSMTELTTEVNGITWYGYNFTGTAGAEYHIQADAGDTILDKEIRYFDMWVEEPSVGSGGGGGGLTVEQALQLANTVKKDNLIIDTDEGSVSIIV